MSRRNDDRFREVWTHDAVIALFRDIAQTHGAAIERHKYDPMESSGTVNVVTKAGAYTSVPYDLPDDRDQLRALAITALQKSEEWKR